VKFRNLGNMGSNPIRINLDQQFPQVGIVHTYLIFLNLSIMKKKYTITLNVETPTDAAELIAAITCCNETPFEYSDGTTHQPEVEYDLLSKPGCCILGTDAPFDLYLFGMCHAVAMSELAKG
jgi:hypothetical protein